MKLIRGMISDVLLRWALGTLPDGADALDLAQTLIPYFERSKSRLAEDIEKRRQP